MKAELFDHADDNTRIWVYAFSSPLDADAKAVIVNRLNEFIAGWNSHNVPVDSAFMIVHDRFVLLAGHCPEGISGCSIDSKVQNFKRLRDDHGLDALNSSLVFFRNAGGEVVSMDRSSFQSEVDAGRVGSDTVVFNTTIQSVADLRSGRFETTFKDSWHARAFPAAGTETRSRAD